MRESLIYVTFFKYFNNCCKNIDEIVIFIRIFVEINYKLNKNAYFKVDINLKLF